MLASVIILIGAIKIGQATTTKTRTPMSAGEMYLVDNATSTVITTQSTFTKVSVTSTQGLMLTDFTFNNNRLTYTGTATKTFHAGLTISHSSAGSNDTAQIILYKNGTVDANQEFTGGTQMTAGKVEHKTQLVGDVVSTAIHTFVSLAQNDYIEIGVSNISDADDFTVKHYNLFLMEMYD